MPYDELLLSVYTVPCISVQCTVRECLADVYDPVAHTAHFAQMGFRPSPCVTGTQQLKKKEEVKKVEGLSKQLVVLGAR